MRVLLLLGILAIIPVCYSQSLYASDSKGYHLKRYDKHHHKHKRKHKHHHYAPCQNGYIEPSLTQVEEMDGLEYNQHEPGYFFAEIGGKFYPDYQNPRFYKDPYCRHHACYCTVEDQKFTEVFYRYYDDEGMSREYYIP